MTDAEFQSILLPGVKPDDFVRVLTKEDLRDLEESRNRQRKAIKSKDIDPELMRLRITI